MTGIWTLLNKTTKTLSGCANSLIEHFDSVQVFATRHDPEQGGTVQFQIGKGNWFARFGQVREWMVYEEQKVKKTVRGDD